LQFFFEITFATYISKEAEIPFRSKDGYKTVNYMKYLEHDYEELFDIKNAPPETTSLPDYAK